MLCGVVDEVLPCLPQSPSLTPERPTDAFLPAKDHPFPVAGESGTSCSDELMKSLPGGSRPTGIPCNGLVALPFYI